MAVLSMYRDNTYPISITAMLNGAPINLSGCTLYFTVKYAATWWSDPDTAAFIQLSTLNGGIAIQSPSANGIAIATIQPAMTSSLVNAQGFVYDWRLIDTGGNVTTIETGTLYIQPDVTRT